MKRSAGHKSKPLIAVSANYLAPITDRRFYIGKALEYGEQELVQYVLRYGGLPALVPVAGGVASCPEIADAFDGLLLSGGEDVSPTWYGEEPRRPEWAGQPERDRFEMGLFEAFAACDKPILGLCRGIQLINVALGGSLYQDLLEDGAVERTHRDPAVYDNLAHDVTIHAASYLHDLYGVDEARVNSVHHQAIRELGGALEVMAESDDGLIEAVRHPDLRYAVAVQWHPEWIRDDQAADGFLDPGPLMRDFLEDAAST